MFNNTRAAVGKLVDVNDGRSKRRGDMGLSSPRCKDAGIPRAVFGETRREERDVGIRRIALVCAGLVNEVRPTTSQG